MVSLIQVVRRPDPGAAQAAMVSAKAASEVTLQTDDWTREELDDRIVEIRRLYEGSS